MGDEKIVEIVIPVTQHDARTSVVQLLSGVLLFAALRTMAHRPSVLDFPWTRILEQATSPGDLAHPGINPMSPALQGVLYCWATREAPYLRPGTCTL